MSGGSSDPSGPEYYIRGLNDTEARGPFSLEQLRSLTESQDPAKGITPETYFYDAASEQWLQIGSHPPLKSALWPEKKKMGFKQKEFVSVNEEKTDSAPAITVQEFLAAAEGKTDETKGKKDKGEQMMAEGDRLRGLQMRQPRHHGVDMFLRLLGERELKRRKLCVQRIDGIAYPQFEIGRDLIVARARGMPAAGGVSDQFGEPRFHVHMHVFQRALELKFSL
ncbi:MAG TPA: hypothetical protein PLQ52_01180, partial [Lacunisphaera sp.]|nr:hypothetical protein [Lacunisphaera sp.]